MAKRVDIKERIIYSLAEAFLSPLLAWVTEQAAKGIPITMNTLKAKTFELFRSNAVTVSEQDEIIVDYTNAFMNGVKCGEQRKETAMIHGMKNAGLSTTQIQFILLQAQETLMRMGTDNLEFPQPVRVSTKTSIKKRKRSH